MLEGCSMRGNKIILEIYSIESPPILFMEKHFNFVKLVF